MQKLTSAHPQVRQVENLKYFNSYLERASHFPNSMKISDLFFFPCEYYLALESVVEDIPRKKRSTPNSGTFSSEQVRLLLPILSDYSQTTNVLCFYHKYYLSCLEENFASEHYGYCCKITELPAVMGMPENDFCPTLWWSEDKTWFFLNDYDLSCGIFGGSSLLGQTLNDVLPFKSIKVSPNISMEDVDSVFWNSIDTPVFRK